MGKTPAASNTKNVKIALPLKYLNSFQRTLEIPLINCETNLLLTWSPTFTITDSTSEAKFAIIDTNLYVPVENLLT